MRGDRAAAQVVAVGEAARQHDQVGTGRKLALAVPNHRGLAAGHELERMRHVALAVGTGKDDNGGLHERILSESRWLLFKVIECPVFALI